VLRSGRCVAHRRAHDTRLKRSQPWRGYDAEWRVVRAEQLAAEPWCRRCRDEDGALTPATVVDHIVPLRQGGARLDPENLQSLCPMHHNRKTAYENRFGRS
jgi:5-methylcytosine-specific restriction protein A